jgi:hypothetical protein
MDSELAGACLMDASIDQLKKLHRDGKLCLFVGAGISKSCGLPDWNVLSAMVIKETWPDTGKFDVFSKLERSARSSYSPRDAMRMPRRKLGQQFNSIVSKCLYLEATALSSSLEAIVSLHNVRRIISSNYDDLLEEGYTKRGVGFRSLVQGDVCYLSKSTSRRRILRNVELRLSGIKITLIFQRHLFELHKNQREVRWDRFH